MNESEKKPYDDLNKKDIERNKAQLAEMAEKGSFTLEDGTDSSTLAPKHKKVKRVYAE